MGKTDKPKVEVGVQPVSEDTWPLVLVLRGLPSPSAGHQMGKGGWPWMSQSVPSLCLGILGAELLTSHPSFC